MQPSTFDKLVKVLEPRYGANAPAVARDILQAHYNFGTTKVRHVTARK